MRVPKIYRNGHTCTFTGGHALINVPDGVEMIRFHHHGGLYVPSMTLRHLRLFTGRHSQQSTGSTQRKVLRTIVNMVQRTLLWVWGGAAQKG